jgi:hypothetical protein
MPKSFVRAQHTDAVHRTVTPQQADDGVVELGLPDGGCVQVSFGTEVSFDADLQNAVLQAMLRAGETEDEVCRALADIAATTGLRVLVSRAGHPTTVVVEVDARSAP